MAVSNSWNSPLQSHILFCSVFFYFVITLYYFPLHANALSFNLTNNNQMSKDVVRQGYANVSNKGIEITPKKQGLIAGRASYKDPLHLWDKASGKLTDFNTYFLFVIDSQGNSSFGDGFAFFLLPYNFNSNLATGAAMGLPILSIDPPKSTPFVAVEFDTYQNLGWDPPNITPGTHVGIDINSITSNATEIWYNNITYGKENEAWISYDSSSKKLSVVFTGYKNNSKINSSLSLLVDLRDFLPELVTIGFSAATGGLYEKHTVKSWSFNSSLQGVPGSPSPSPSPSPSTNPSPTVKSNPSTSPSPSPSTNSSPSPSAVNSGIGKKMSGGIDYQIIFFGWLVGFAWLYIVGK
ncbi:hypothetical protein ACSBR1_022475 [Camellia fascicularis]